jgi:hypothetical protein
VIYNKRRKRKKVNWEIKENGICHLEHYRKMNSWEDLR